METHRAVEAMGFNPEHPWEACRVSASRATPSPGPHQVLVRVLCSPFNPSDVMALQGRYLGWQPSRFPCTPGFEGMGAIAKIGEDVDHLSIGQRVVLFLERPESTGQGTWQEYVLIPAMRVLPVPDSISNEVAAQFIVNPGTVVGLFWSLDVPKGEYVLQTAGASVLGRMFIQYARHQGIKTISIVRRDEQIEELKALGANEVINSNHGDLVEKVSDITGGKLAYGAIDCVGGELTKKVVESIRDGGTVLVYGALSSANAEIRITDLLFCGVKVHGFWLKTYLSQLSASELAEFMGHIMSILSERVIEPLVGEKFNLDQVKEAIKKSLEPSRGGKVLLVTDEENTLNPKP